MKASTICTTDKAASPQRNGIAHSGFCPVSRRSRKIREKAGLMMPIREVMQVVRTVKMIAVFAPRSLCPAKVSTLLGFPPGSKSSVGSNIRQMPVKDLSNCSMGTE